MQLDYDLWQIIAIILTYLSAAFAKGISGLGFSTMCLPFLAMTVGLKDALSLVIIPSVLANLIIMHGAGQFTQTIQRFHLMLLATIPGLLIGLWILDVIDGGMAGALLGGILIIWCLVSFAKPDFRLKPSLENPLGVISGFLTGVVNGLTGSQVMPSLPYLMALGLNRQMFVQAMNCSFTLSSFVMALGLMKLDLFSIDAVLVSLIGTFFAFLGLKLGESYRSRLSTEMFRRTVLVMLSMMGASLIIRTIF
ncbi:sulfite exporter TauE/SafE family protein [Cohaesibacter gelatinilyticus]|uniref:Probable membrane transporter protein n=1 Tax=Cohaesibacter gelatinilyticus TaxID=372072 RepID=A0A285NBE7_9HYPH|nr:sulfite exporter TauE/SafE family protein [Cohaesibacter gelatinilyticus]SNZ06785.1 hypothetical protein SAMN06265368_0537 [Cohaesibacter gelatinilyticus]HAT85041.1 sulfite exporter TauE/SafE family protein [Hyphomicrobiales bacterium]